MQPREQFILSFRERGNRQAIDAGTALVLPDMFPGFGQIGPTTAGDIAAGMGAAAMYFLIPLYFPALICSGRGAA
jgi:hypothetical protein